MQHALSTFDFNTHTIRAVTMDGDPWFLAADVCRVLAMPLDKGVGKYLGNLSADEKRPVTPGQIGGKSMSRTSLISETGLYKLILRSDKPEARPFQDWVTKVVLPAIRKHGGYVAGEKTLGRPGGMDEEELVEHPSHPEPQARTTMEPELQALQVQ
ncbi:BRO-N domain-containing protein [Methylobacterium brachythecii]|uniref:Prophage antirepressor-like protein n=1 Tax=Methylobacterium brachythecii TaxID=1176177 RepID=A0A7W6F6Y2_9HYPH|nr:BRO family protein [Methylobacterium brachythecii]MBB3902808.1 prophage antirepressor-like protein [Methylobacterium brachythecii]GLS43733.1 hypothetical protein GCM10007884_17180 [Methylobacterium brachythecii]